MLLKLADHEVNFLRDCMEPGGTPPFPSPCSKYKIQSRRNKLSLVRPTPLVELLPEFSGVKKEMTIEYFQKMGASLENFPYLEFAFLNRTTELHKKCIDIARTSSPTLVALAPINLSSDKIERDTNLKWLQATVSEMRKQTLDMMNSESILLNEGLQRLDNLTRQGLIQEQRNTFTGNTNTTNTTGDLTAVGPSGVIINQESAMGSIGGSQQSQGGLSIGTLVQEVEEMESSSRLLQFMDRKMLKQVVDQAKECMAEYDKLKLNEVGSSTSEILTPESFLKAREKKEQETFGEEQMQIARQNLVNTLKEGQTPPSETRSEPPPIEQPPEINQPPKMKRFFKNFIEMWSPRKAISSD